MATVDLTLTGCSIPTNTSASVTIYEDTNGDGVAENSDTISLSNGVTSYTSSDVFAANANDHEFWLSFQTDNTDTVSAAELTVGATLTVTATPYAPSSLSASQGAEDQLDLAWTDNADDEDGFYVYRAQASGTSTADYTRIADLAPGTTTYTDTALEDGERYYYRVSAYNADGESGLSNEDSAVTVLPAPSLSSLDASVEDEITLGFSNNDDSVDGTIDIYRSTDGTLGSRIAQVTYDAVSFTDDFLPDGEKFYYTLRRSTDHANTDSAQKSATTILPNLTSLAASVSGDDISVSWTDNADNEDQYEVYYRKNTEESAWTSDAVLAANSTSHTITGLLDGEQYDVRVEVSTEHVAHDQTLIPAETTALPDAQQPGLGNSVEDEINVTWSDVIDNGHYDLQYRATGATTWLNEPEQTEVSTSHTITGLDDGEEYEVRMRTQTEHVTGSWTSPVSIVTVFPGVTGLTVTGTTSTSVSLEATDNADAEDGVEVWRRDELDPARDTGYSAWSQIDDIGPFTGTGVFTYTDTGLDPNHDYQYYLVSYTEHTSDQTGTVTTTTDVSYGPDWTLELRRADGDILTLDEDEGFVEGSLEWQWATSTIASWSLEVPPTPILEDWLDSEAFLWYNGSLWIRGPWHRFGDGHQSLEGKGNGWRLKQGGASRRYQSIEGYNAVEDYINTETPFTAAVTAPSTNTIDEDKVVQDADTTSELESVLAGAATTPVHSSGGVTQLATTCFTREAEDYTRRNNATEIGRTGFSGGDPGGGVELNNLGDWVEYDITLNYTMPASAVTAAFRKYATSDNPEITVSIDGSAIYTFPAGVGADATGWSTNAGSWSSDLAAGSHTVRFENTASNTGTFELDVVATPYDGRYAYNFDNSVDANGYLDGPELKPGSATVESAEHDDVNNVVGATLTTTMTTGPTAGQALQLSNDGGTNWYPQDGTETSTTSVDIVDFPTVGSRIRGRATLARTGSRTDATPKQGFTSDEIDTWTLDITTNSLAVIDDRRYTGNHFENIKSLCSDAGLEWLAKHEDGSLTLEAFAPGDLTDTITLTDEDVEDHDRVVDREGYGNKVTVFGAIDDVTGAPLEATTSSSTEIAEHGEVLAEAQSDKRLTSQADVDNFASQVLAQAIASRGVTGALDVVPSVMGTPGREYTLSYGDFANDPVVLEKLRYSDLRGVHMDFESDRDVAAALAQLRGGLKQTSDAIK